MNSIESIIQKQQRQGYTIFDDFLSREIFEYLNQKVLRRWSNKSNWNTRAKPAGETRVLPFQSDEKIASIRAVLDSVRIKNPQAFTYLYHSLHQDNDQQGLVVEVREAILKAKGSLIKELAGATSHTNFSLTSFTPGCYLDMHTDNPSNDVPYKMTVLLYFGIGVSHKHADLTFNYHGTVSNVKPIPNRCVLFKPTRETNHGIPPRRLSEN